MAFATHAAVTIVCLAGVFFGVANYMNDAWIATAAASACWLLMPARHFRD